MATLQCAPLLSMVMAGCKMQLHMCRNLALPVSSAFLARGGNAKEARRASILMAPLRVN